MTSLTPSVAETVTAFREYVLKITHYQEALNLMYWDLRTGAPKKGLQLRSEAIGTLSSEVFRMSTSPEMEHYLNVLSDPSVYPSLDPITQATVRVLRKEFERSRKIPPERHHAYVVLTSQAESVWEDAKERADFAAFRPYLEQIVAFKIEFAEAWGYAEHRYDALLDEYEPGVTVRQLDPLFDELRRETVALVEAITQTGRRPLWASARRTFDIAKQRELSLRMLEKMGYDFGAGRLDETVHPFQSTINRFDTRVTTRYLEDDLLTSLFGTIHEGGHALYEQGISTDLIGTPLCQGASMGMHESQSRFWENIIGRSREFWECHYKELLQLFPTQFADVSLDDFYRAINDVHPSLIRIDADEVTYNLHILIRYELEKALISGDLKVADLPGVWNEKMRAYLGVVPSHDGEGVLQDVHWAGGDFGYFPSYTLGNLYAAQFLEALAKAVPDYKVYLRRGDVVPILTWLRENIHRYGRMLEPAEILQRATGKPLEVQPWLRYLKEKFGPIYGL